MTVTELVNSLLHSRPAGDGRWMARCPAHNDRSPSLSIRAGRDGRVLVRCWAGCRTKQVLAKLGLNWKDICGEPMTDAQARQAMAERRKRREQELLQRSADRAACDRIRRLEAVADELSPQPHSNSLALTRCGMGWVRSLRQPSRDHGWRCR